MSRGQQNVAPHNQGAVQCSNAPPSAVYRCPLDNQMLENMRKSMTDELEQRRLAWEKDVIRLQEDFFKVKLGDASTPAAALQRPLALGSPEGELAPVDNSARLLPNDPLEKEEGVFKLRFNVRDYSPDDINVRAEGNRLIVSAKHIEGDGTRTQVTKHFNKQVDIPENVEIEKLISYLSSDGILTVEAPLIPGKPASNTCMHTLMQAPHIYSSSKATPAIEDTSPPYFPSPFQNPPLARSNDIPPPGSRLPIAGATDVYNTEYGRMLMLRVDLGRQDYRPNEVKVKVYQNKISVSALHEEVCGGRTSKREFQREFELPEPIEMSTLRAALDVNAGLMFIGGSFVSNTKHNMVLYLITQQMPVLGKQCAIEQQY